MWDLRTSAPLFALTTLAACCKGPPRPTGLVIVGGDPEGGTSVELWSPQEQCRLPPLDRLMFSPTVDTLGAPGGWWVVACDGDLCFELKKKPAAEIAKEAKAYHAAKKKNKKRRKPKKLIEPPKGRWENLTTIEWRVAHTSAITPDGLLLVGGSGSPNTTELIPRKREEGEGGYMGFSLEIGRQFHCSIQIDETSIVLTGGLGTETLVTEHTDLGDLEDAVSREIANLTIGRYYHACGMYTVGEYEAKMLIVTGGWNGEVLGSTEVLGYTSYLENEGRGEWRQVNQLPTPLWGMRGASVAGVFHITGGWMAEDGHWIDTDEILAWNPKEDSWSVAGSMISARDWESAHGVTEILLGAVTSMCLSDEIPLDFA